MEADLRDAVIVSDLHIGLPYFRRAAFVRLIRSLDAGTALVLNGDTIDNPGRRLSGEDVAVVEVIRDESLRRQLVWIYGNHDENVALEDPGRIVFARHLIIGRRLMVVHGDDFDDLMPRNRLFMRFCKRLHRLRIRLGASPVHVAEFAKSWFPLFYRVLRRQVKLNAVRCAAENGVEAITCGHTHYMEDCHHDGVRYINTGSWTEPRRCYIHLTQREVKVIRVS